MESTNPKDKIGRTKPPLHLIPPAAEVQEAVVMGLGASKYGPFNWRDHSVAASVYIAAAKRHIAQWFDGQNIDPESGAGHLAHARACLGILLDAEAIGKLVDDRPPAGDAAGLIQRLTKVGAADRPKKIKEEAPLARYNVDEKLRHSGCPESVRSVIMAGLSTPPDGPPSGGRTVYIAGPMRGHEDFNFPAFDRARDEFLERGYIVINPADIDRAAGDVPEDTTNGIYSGITRAYCFRDFHALHHMKGEEGDAVAMLPGWEKSTGATAEFMLARWMKLAVLDAATGEPLQTVDVGDLCQSVIEFLKGQVAQKNLSEQPE